MSSMKLRYFSIGMLIAVAVISLFHVFAGRFDSKPEPEEAKEGYTMIETERLHLFEEKIASLENENKSLQNKLKDMNKTEKNGASDEELTFEIRQGMSLQDIARSLEGIKIIDNRKEFTDFMIKNGHEKNIQPGEYTFTRGMSFEEIAKTITK